MGEQVVWTRSEDDIELDGLAVEPEGPRRQDLAAVMIHGVGGRFYWPLMTLTGRGLAARGLPAVVTNNRGHDIGTFVVQGEGQRLLRGAAWEAFDDCLLDVAAWVDHACRRFGVSRVLLFGHSLGGMKVSFYQAERGDARVAGLALCSPVHQGLVHHAPAEMLADARARVAAGRGEELMAWPTIPIGRMSAQGIVARAESRSRGDLIGLVRRVVGAGLPVFACYGSGADNGGQPQLDALAAAGAATRLVPGANHMYTGQEDELAEAVSAWAAAALEAD